jgi:hypothetical protein
VHDIACIQRYHTVVDDDVKVINSLYVWILAACIT